MIKSIKKYKPEYHVGLNWKLNMIFKR